MKRRLQLALLSVSVVAAILLPNRMASHVTTTNTVMFDREVVDILSVHCTGCHNEGGMSFPLETYEQAWLRRNDVLSAVLGRHMPPWPAVSGYGSFANANKLTLRETHFLISWVEGLGPRNIGQVFLNVLGAGAAPAEIRAEVDFESWELGEPDWFRTLPPASAALRGEDLVYDTVMELGLDTEVRIRGFEYHPSDRGRVRAASFFDEDTGRWLGSWTPWRGFVELPEAAGFLLPAGSRVRARIHYAGEVGEGQSQGMLGFHESDSIPEFLTSDLVVDAGDEFDDLPGGRRYQASVSIDTDTHAIALLPEFDAGVRSIEVSLRFPDGGTEILLFARDIPTQWPTPYVFSAPVLMPAGSVLRATAYYDAGDAGRLRLTVSGYQG